MNHVCCRASSDKEKLLNVFNKQVKTTEKNYCSVNRFTAHCKCLMEYSKTDGQHKIKRRRSRRERRQRRGGGKEASNSKSHHHYCHLQTSKDTAHFHNCCHRSCHCPPRRDAPFPNVITTAQEPSIITDSRLIGHQGLFNHEVKSIDIERLLSEQRKLEKNGQQVQEKNNATSRPSSTSHIPSPFSMNDLLDADTDKVVPSKKKLDPDPKAHDDFKKKEEKISQGSDLTPGQRPQQQLDLSSQSYKSISSKHSSLDVVVMKSLTRNSVMSEKGRQSQRTLNKMKGHLISTLEHPPKNQDSPVPQTQTHSLTSSPLQLSSSHAADSFDIQHGRQDSNHVSKSVSAVAAGLCDYLQFPLLRRRSLVAESRELLLKALQERHGSQLQDNLLEVQRCLRFGTDPTKEVQDQEPTTIDENEFLPTDTFTTANTASQSGNDTQKTTTFKNKRSRHFNWNSSPQLHHNLKQTAEWLTNPVETPVSLLHDILKPTCSPQFCMNFEPSEDTASNHWFAPSPTSCWGEKAPAPHHWEDRFNRPKSKEAVMFGFIENSFMNHTRAVTRRSSGSQYNDSNIQPFFPYQTQLPDRHSVGPMHYPQEQDPFETDRYSFPPSFSAKVHHPQPHHHFQRFSQFSHPSICPPLRSHHTDIMHYPPSHMLERDPAHPLPSFPSPEHWSFPPMRLY